MKRRPTLCRIDAVGGAQDFYYAAHGPETQLILSYFDYKYGARSSIGSDPNCIEIRTLLGSMGEEILIDHDSSLEILRTCWDMIRAREKSDSGALLIKAVDSRGKLK